MVTSLNNFKKNNGLTLIELLVALVILSFTIALMSTAISQVAQMIRVGAEQSNGFLVRWNNTRAIYDITSNLLIDSNLEVPFSGNATIINTTTSSMPEKPRGIPYPIKLELKKNQLESITNLTIYTDLDSNNEKHLANFSGRVEFRYIDHTGKENIIWPPDSAGEYRLMPSSILLIDIDQHRHIIKSAKYEGALSPPPKGMADFLRGSQQ